MPKLAGLTTNRNRQAAHGLNHHADEHWSARAFCAVAPDAWQVEGHNPQSRKIGEARHGCFVHCPVFRQCKAAGIEVRSAVLAGTYYTDAGKVSDWQPAAASCRHCRPGGA